MTDTASGPLRGLKIVDISTVVAGGAIRIEAAPSQEAPHRHRQFTGEPDANKAHVDDDNHS